MPWKDTTKMEQKIEFICEWRTGKHSITELCKSFEISRPTAYKIIARFEKEGYEGLRELSRKPRGLHPNSTNEKVVNGILQLKEKHKLWGAKNFEAAIAASANLAPADSLVEIEKKMLKFAKGISPGDDYTMIAIDMK